MNQKELRSISINDRSAASLTRLSAWLAEVAALAPRGVVAPERAKDGGYVIIHRTRLIRRTAYTVAAAAGCGERALKSVGGLHAAGRAAYICRAIAEQSDGRIYCPRAVRETAEEYEREMRRMDYAAVWHNLSVRHDSAYALKAAAVKADKAAARNVRAQDAAIKAAEAVRAAEAVKASAAADVQLAAARAAAERGAEVAALQDECETDVA